MPRSSTISSKGQITVPLEIRKRLGLKQGDRVEFVVDGGRTTMRPARLADNPFLKYVGALPAFSNLKAINTWVRGLRGDKKLDR
jgi:antitoxin PrlF